MLVDPHLARVTMEVYLAADLSAELNEVIEPAADPDQVSLALAELYVDRILNSRGAFPPARAGRRPRPARLLQEGERVGRAHVERVVGAEQHVLGTEPVDQLPDHCGSKTLVSKYRERR